MIHRRNSIQTELYAVLAAMMNRPRTYPKVNNLDLVSAYLDGRNSIQSELYAMLVAMRNRPSTYPKAVNNIDLAST